MSDVFEIKVSWSNKFWQNAEYYLTPDILINIDKLKAWRNPNMKEPVHS